MKSSMQDHLEGTAKNLAGNVKQTTGKVLGNPRLQAEGQANQVEGRIQQKLGDVKKVFGR